MSTSLLEVQQKYAEDSGCQAGAVWDSLHQADDLRRKIVTLTGGDYVPRTSELLQKRKRIFESVWAQRVYTDKVLVVAVFYVLVTEKTEGGYAVDHSTRYSRHPVFRTRKCLSDNNDNNGGCCMVYIDMRGRIYRRWASYLAENVLPRGVMVAPPYGIYQFDESGRVILMKQATPVSLPSADLLRSWDCKMALSMFASFLPAVIPGLAPFAVVANVARYSAVAYMYGRGAAILYDDVRHCRWNNALESGDRRVSGLVIATTGLGCLGTFAAIKALKSCTENTQNALQGVKTEKDPRDLALDISANSALMSVLTEVRGGLYRIDWTRFALKYGPKVIERITKVRDFESLFEFLIDTLSEVVVDLILRIAGSVVSDLFSISNVAWVSSEWVVTSIMMLCKSYKKTTIDYLLKKEAEMREFVLHHINILAGNYSYNLRKECQDCSGHYYVCDM